MGPTARFVATMLVAVLAVAGCVDTFEKTGDGGGGICTPGEGKCEGEVTFRCDPSGMTWTQGETCVWPATCFAGECVDPCSTAKAERSYVGCEYFAVDLDNAPSKEGYSPRDAQFAIVVSYAGKTEHAVRVKVFTMVGGKETMVSEGDVYPGEVTVFKVGPQNVVGSTKGVSAFRVSAAAPVTAYQFNPLNNTLEAYSNDASLLLPVPSLETDYIAVTADGIVISDISDPLLTYDMGSFVTVVGVTDNTQVTITPTVPIIPGPGVTAGTAPVTQTINRYEVLSISSDVKVAGSHNLSGTTVKADKPVAVFAGNGATVIPNGTEPKCCADHLEQQMIPFSAWGKTFVAARTRPRKTSGTPEPDWWSLTGGAAGVKLTYSPSTPTGAPTQLDKGQSVSFHTTGSFVVEASGPILLTQFMASAEHTGAADINHPCTTDNQCTGLGFEAACHEGYCGPVGDPAMILVPPVEQFRNDYVFLVPDDYYLDYATFIVPMDIQLTLDDTKLTQKPTSVGTIGGTAYGLLHMTLTDGKHRASADQPFGVLVYGVDAYVSYGYPAGLDLKRINLE
jgi:hypothetical protein